MELNKINIVVLKKLYNKICKKLNCIEKKNSHYFKEMLDMMCGETYGAGLGQALWRTFRPHSINRDVETARVIYQAIHKYHTTSPYLDFENFLTEHNALQNYKNNITRANISFETIINFPLDELINYGFTWADTSEGHVFWRKLDDLWRYKIINNTHYKDSRYHVDKQIGELLETL